MTTTATVTMRTVTARAKALGVTIRTRKDPDQLFHEIELSAPDGYLLKGTGTHHSVSCGSGDPQPFAALYPLALNDMAMGLERCDDAQCDICSERADDSADD